MHPMQELDIVRAAPLTVRADATLDEGMPLLEVRFSPFGVWYEIDSWWEGTFMERTMPGAFSKTIEENRDRIKVLFNHGYDPQIGDKVLGMPEDIREEADSAVGDVRLFDTSYVRDLLPGLEAGAYGSSMMMRVIKDEWNDEPGVSEHNPKGLPERTILEVRLFEFGPVTFPANPDATSGVRSDTDRFYDLMRSREPEQVAALEVARNSRTLPGSAAGSTTARRGGAADNPTDEPARSHSGGLTRAQRERLIHMNVRKHGKES